MTRLAIDYENPARTWWESGGQELWDSLLDPGENSVVLDDDVARSWLKEASQIPGWSEGPEYAPHPIVSGEADEGDMI
jgi:hypothetical protein